MGTGPRVLRVARLDDSVFDEVAGDELATGSALVVLLAAVALDALGSAGGLDDRLLALVEGAGRAGLWILAIHFGARVLGLSDALAPLFRAIAFAQAPLALGLLDALPGIGGVVWIAKWALVFTTTVLAAGRVLPLSFAGNALLCATALGVALLVNLEILP